MLCAIFALLTLTLATLLFPAAGEAATLTIGVQADATTLDPHYFPLVTNTALHRHIYDSLLTRDPELRLVPNLAERWHAIDDTHWEFDLRSGVTFSDGTPFTADDVAFSLRRAAGASGSAGTFAQYTRAITGIDVLGPERIRITTATPYPQLPQDLSLIQIVSATLAANARPEDFNHGKAIGTGPFRLVRWVPGEQLELERNPGYWGDKPAWDRVVFRPIPNDATRLAALLSGDVDVIDKVPMEDVARLRKEGRVEVVVHAGNRVMYLVPDTQRDESPYVTDGNGHAIVPNPLKQLAVRQAISLAMNRKALVERVMSGLGEVANQIVPAGMIGHSGRLPPAGYDPEAARRKLAEAGYPNGFRLVLHCSNDRYVNDEKTCLAAAQMLSRIGIATTIDAAPQTVFFPRLGRYDDSLILIGWGNDGGDSVTGLRGALHSVDRAHGLGGFNRGRYANSEVDRLIDAAGTTLDPDERARLQQQAMEAAMNDVAVIPLFTNAWIWATRKGLSFTAGFDEGTPATRVSATH
jgi:peptide/nickel transport system substrate-binding protein